MNIKNWLNLTAVILLGGLTARAEPLAFLTSLGSWPFCQVSGSTFPGCASYIKGTEQYLLQVNGAEGPAFIFSLKYTLQNGEAHEIRQAVLNDPNPYGYVLTVITPGGVLSSYNIQITELTPMKERSTK